MAHLAVYWGLKELPHMVAAKKYFPHRWTQFKTWNLEYVVTSRRMKGRSHSPRLHWWYTSPLSFPGTHYSVPVMQMPEVSCKSELFSAKSTDSTLGGSLRIADRSRVTGRSRLSEGQFKIF